MNEYCVFCGDDPYHREDVGVGAVPVAVVCCEPGIAFYSREPDPRIFEIGSEIAKIRQEVIERENAIDVLRRAADVYVNE